MGGERVLKGIQIENVRSLKNTGMLSLSPINVLVGENSSGKSTFLRTFPLLKQSICKRTSGPLLWAGDFDDYVDFGSFKETVTNDGSKSITFKFQFQLDDSDFSRINFSPFDENGNDSSSVDILYELTVVPEAGKERVSQLILKYNRTTFVFDLCENKIFVDGIQVETKEEGSADTEIEFAYPSMIFGRRAQMQSVFEFTLPNIPSAWKYLDKLLSCEEKTDSGVVEMTKRRVIAFAGEELLKGIPLCDLVNRAKTRFKDSEVFGVDMLNCLTEIYNAAKQGSAKETMKIITYLKLYAMYWAYPVIDMYLSNYFEQVHYIAPLRATAERYYRLRNLAIDEIDFQGKNLAVFLNSLTNEKLRAFQQWTSEHFGFSVYKSTSEGHLSLKIKLRNSKEQINLSDTGFGYSQILPIITLLWEISSRKKENTFLKTPLVIAIEQPELHLHPAMQARLTKAFIACLRLAEKNGYQLQLILETHSETIVNYLGREIARGTLTSNDVSVILFEKNNETNLTAVRMSNYDENGYLQNWPYGFFAAGE